MARSNALGRRKKRVSSLGTGDGDVSTRLRERRRLKQKLGRTKISSHRYAQFGDAVWTLSTLKTLVSSPITPEKGGKASSLIPHQRTSTPPRALLARLEIIEICKIALKQSQSLVLTTHLDLVKHTADIRDKYIYP